MMSRKTVRNEAYKWAWSMVLGQSIAQLRVRREDVTEEVGEIVYGLGVDTDTAFGAIYTAIDDRIIELEKGK